ncbi:response regulator [Ralstonia sp. UBA689]|uniref:response regulator n=1 Tax=Ralstonia sp. UBA689 TaxID=1947373 RepID=UPI0025E890FA|nr:response regulator [Ralstonia sp. UBA689]
MSTAPRHSILVVEDDHAMRRMLIEYLASHGYRLDGAANVAEAMAAFSATPYDLVLLDLTLPDGDGMELARQWHSQAPTPIIHITGRTEEADRIMGLELGADDYIVKPFSLREVLARVRALLRRVATAAQPVPVRRGKQPRAWHFSGWTLNLNTRRLMAPNGHAVSLTNAEFNLLAVFLSAPRRVISRDALLQSTRAFDDVYDRAIDVQIMRLRRKLESDPKKPVLLRTERGAGYLFDADVVPLWD